MYLAGPLRSAVSCPSIDLAASPCRSRHFTPGRPGVKMIRSSILAARAMPNRAGPEPSMRCCADALQGIRADGCDRR